MYWGIIHSIEHALWGKFFEQVKARGMFDGVEEGSAEVFLVYALSFFAS